MAKKNNKEFKTALMTSFILLLVMSEISRFLNCTKTTDNMSCQETTGDFDWGHPIVGFEIMQLA